MAELFDRYRWFFTSDKERALARRTYSDMKARMFESPELACAWLEGRASLHQEELSLWRMSCEPSDYKIEGQGHRHGAWGRGNWARGIEVVDGWEPGDVKWLLLFESD